MILSASPRPCSSPPYPVLAIMSSSESPQSPETEQKPSLVSSCYAVLHPPSPAAGHSTACYRQEHSGRHVDSCHNMWPGQWGLSDWGLCNYDTSTDTHTDRRRSDVSVTALLSAMCTGHWEYARPCHIIYIYIQSQASEKCLQC